MDLLSLHLTSTHKQQRHHHIFTRIPVKLRPTSLARTYDSTSPTQWPRKTNICHRRRWKTSPQPCRSTRSASMNSLLHHRHLQKNQMLVYTPVYTTTSRRLQSGPPPHPIHGDVLRIVYVYADNNEQHEHKQSAAQNQIPAGLDPGVYADLYESLPPPPPVLPPPHIYIDGVLHHRFPLPTFIPPPHPVHGELSELRYTKAERTWTWTYESGLKISSPPFPENVCCPYT